MRPSFEDIYMTLAETISKRSSCSRLQVGTVITSTDYRKVLALGYNGSATGLPNGCEQNTPGNCGCLHSECNAVINCDVPRYVEKVVFVTHLPCTNCAKMLINMGNVVKIYFKNYYRDTSSLQLFGAVGIAIEHLNGVLPQEPIR